MESRSLFNVGVTRYFLHFAATPRTLCLFHQTKSLLI